MWDDYSVGARPQVVIARAERTSFVTVTTWMTNASRSAYAIAAERVNPVAVAMSGNGMKPWRRRSLGDGSRRRCGLMTPEVLILECRGRNSGRCVAVASG